MSTTHAIRYDGIDYDVTPDILIRVFIGINTFAQDGRAVIQRLDLLSENGSVLLVLGLGTGLTFRTTTQMAQHLVPISDG